MIKVIHRVNTVKDLLLTPPEFGVEADIRAWKNALVLSHEPFRRGEHFKEYLKSFRHALLVCNIKETGIEENVIGLVKKYGVDNFFLLDVEFSYLYRAARAGMKNIAIRYSEDECIDTALKYRGLVDWVWIDTNAALPLDEKSAGQLRGFKTCLVSPDRWNRPEDIPAYRKRLEALRFPLDAVMVGKEHVTLWE